MNNSGAKNLIQEIDDDFVTLAEENATKVRFVEEESHHRPEDNIFVVYELCNGFKPSSRDWIGLYSASHNGVNDYLNFQWAPRYARDEKFPNFRGVLFPAGEVDITPSATDKYLFMYISKANQILAQSQKFYISYVDPETDLDLVCVEDDGDLDNFTLVRSTPEKEQGNFEVVKAYGDDVPSVSPLNKKYSDHVTLSSDVTTGHTLLEIFNDVTDEKALVPYTGSGPVVLYSPKKTEPLPPSFIEMVNELENFKIPQEMFTCPIVQEFAVKQNNSTKEDDVDLEALRVELEYVDNNLNEQRNLVKELNSKVENLGVENGHLSMTNEKLYRNLRNLRNDKESVESELAKCRSKIEALQTIVRLHKKGNKTLQEECKKAQEEARKSNYTTERLVSDLNLLEQQKSELEESLAEHLDINGNVKKEDPVSAEEPADDNDTEGWTVATSRRTDRKQKLIERLERNLAEEKSKCEQLEIKLKDCQDQIEKLQSDVKGHQSEEQKLVEQICEEKNNSNSLGVRVKELTAEIERIKKDNEKLTQEVALVKRQKMRAKRHLVEREEELIVRVQSLEDALKASKLINKKAKRQCEAYNQTFCPTSSTNTQTPKTQTADRASLTEKICGPVQDLSTAKKPRVVEKKGKKTSSWDEYFENFKNSWWNERSDEAKSKKTSKSTKQKESSSTSAQAIFSFHDPLFPFPIFPLADNEELPSSPVVEEPHDLTMSRTVKNEASSSTSSPRSSESKASTSSSDSSTSSWDQQVEDESEELVAVMGGGSYGIRDIEEIDLREKKKSSARKTTAYIASKQAKAQAQAQAQAQEQKEEKAGSSEKSSKKSGTKKFTRRFVCHTRRFRFPGNNGNSSNSRGSRSNKGNPPVSPLTK